jgi:hypothetical protein
VQEEFARFVNTNKLNTNKLNTNKLNTNKVIRINKHISKLFIKLIINLIKSRNIKMLVVSE